MALPSVSLPASASAARPARVGSRRLRFVVRRLLHLVIVLLLVTLLTTFLIELIPGDPATAMIGESATPEQIDAINERLGLDDPFFVRYAHWLGDVVTGDLGTSTRTGEPVTDALLQRLPVTLELASLALIIALLVAIPVGIMSAYQQGRRMDRITTVIASAMISAPSFLTAMILSYLFAVRWKVLPVTGWVPLTENPIENMRHAILPVLSMATLEIAVFIRLLRSDMISTLREDFVLAARSTGLPRWRILFQYALRPSSFSLVTLAGIVLGRLIAGTVIVETIFALPGIGQYVVSAIYNKDVVVVQGVLLFVAVSYVVINAVVDLSYLWLDPRVRAREVSS